MTLLGGIEAYIDMKRAGGVLFYSAAKNLRSFSKKVGDVPLDTIRPAQILEFLNGPRTRAGTWRKKFSLLKLFFEYWSARGMLGASPMPPIRLPAAQTLVPYMPYVYTRNEVRLLLRATSLWGNCSWQNRDMARMDSRTFRIFLLTLYATGMRTGEALNLLRKDVDVNRGAVSIRGGLYSRSRTMPIGPDLRARLRQHQRRLPKVRGEGLFFVGKDCRVSMRARCELHSANCVAWREFSVTMGLSTSPACTTYERRSRCIDLPAGSGRAQS